MLARACQRFGNLQAGESFTRAAGHNEFAAVCVRQAARNGIQRIFLMVAQLLPGFQHRSCFGLVSAPINLAVFQIVQVYLADGRLLVAQGVFSVFAPMIGRADNDAVSEYFLARCGKKTVDVALLQTVVFVVELALDSVIFAGAGFGDQINTGIFPLGGGGEMVVIE